MNGHNECNQLIPLISSLHLLLANLNYLVSIFLIFKMTIFCILIGKLMLAMDLFLWWSLEAFKNPSRKCLFLWAWPTHRWPYLNRPVQIEKTTKLNGFKFEFYCNLSMWVDVALLHWFFSVSPLVDLITLEWVITVQIMAEWANICRAFYLILSAKLRLNVITSCDSQLIVWVSYDQCVCIWQSQWVAKEWVN